MTAYTNNVHNAFNAGQGFLIFLKSGEYQFNICEDFCLYVFREGKAWNAYDCEDDELRASGNTLKEVEARCEEYSEFFLECEAENQESEILTASPMKTEAQIEDLVSDCWSLLSA